MQNNDFFAPGRTFMMLKRQSVLNYNTWLISLGALGGLLFLINIPELILSGQYNYDRFLLLGYFAFFTGGFLLSGGAFAEVNKPGKSILFMTVPSSSFEKFLAAWLTTSPLFIIAAMFSMSLISVIASLLGAIIHGASWQVFNPFEFSNIRIAGIYMVLQTIFLAGSVYFNSNHFLKTLFSVILFMIFLNLWSSLIFYAFLEPIWPVDMDFKLHWDSDEGLKAADVPITGYETLVDIFQSGYKILFWGIAGPFFLLFSYFRLKEQEV